MPTVEPTGSRVLATGANGYIAMWVIRTLLEQGYAVRGTVRSLEKGKRLKENFGSYGNKLELCVVEDMLKKDAFDEAVKDIEAIEHAATLVSLDGIEPDDYIKPALQGTSNVLESALRFGDRVKRIIITSSVAAIYHPVKEPTFTFDETYWADEYVELVEERGKEADPLIKYSVSKTLGEKAAWDFYKKHKNEVKWDLVALHPPYVFGPTLQDVKTPDHLNASMNIFWNKIAKDIPDEALKETYSFVDVRDVAIAHVAALRKEKAGGERIITANSDLIHSLQPELYTSGILPHGNPNLDPTVLYKYNAEKSKRILGLEYTSPEKTISDILADFEARGWLEKRPDA